MIWGTLSSACICVSRSVWTEFTWCCTVCRSRGFWLLLFQVQVVPVLWHWYDAQIASSHSLNRKQRFTASCLPIAAILYAKCRIMISQKGANKNTYLSLFPHLAQLSSLQVRRSSTTQRTWCNIFLFVISGLRAIGDCKLETSAAASACRMAAHESLFTLNTHAQVVACHLFCCDWEKTFTCPSQGSNQPRRPDWHQRGMCHAFWQTHISC